MANKFFNEEQLAVIGNAVSLIDEGAQNPKGFLMILTSIVEDMKRVGLPDDAILSHAAEGVGINIRYVSEDDEFERYNAVEPEGGYEQTVAELLANALKYAAARRYDIQHVARKLAQVNAR